MTFNESHIEIFPDSGIQKTIAANIASESIGSWNGTVLSLSHNEVHDVEYSRLSLLGLPSLFSGYMIIKMQGTPNMSNCRFSLHFANESGHPFSLENRFGSVLKISRNELYLLPKLHYEICEKVLKANQTNDEFDRWSVIVMAKNGDEKIRFEGLPQKDSIQTIDQVELDLIQEQDGSITLDPKLGDLTSKTRNVYDARLDQEERDGLIMTEVDATGTKRYVAPKKILTAVKRIRQTKRIPKEDVTKFLENPGSFLLQNEEEEADIAINTGSYRIIGIGEPYVGYFGTKKIDTPIAKALLQDDDLISVQKIHEKVKETIDGCTIEEIHLLSDDIKNAIENKLPSFKSLNTEFFEPEYPEVEKLLENIIKNKDLDENKNKKGVIQILPNDEIDIVFEEENDQRKPIDQIKTNDREKGALFSNLKYDPKNYQIAGVNWLIDLYESGYRGGILADDMGLGKTYQVIAFLNYLFYHKQTQGRVLIVAPTILIDNWRNEIHKFIINQSKFRVKILRGNDLGYRSDIRGHEDKSYNYFDPELLLEVEGFPTVMITTYQTMSNYQFSFAEEEKFNFECIIYDEAHSIKNPNAQISQAARAISSKIPFSILLTGTPIENELRDLWALFDVFDPTHFGSWKSFKKEFISNTYENIDEKLRSKASNYILRRLKKDYLSELPPKEEKVREILFDQEDEKSYLSIVNSDQAALTRLHRLKAFSIHKILTECDKSALANINQGTFESYSKIHELIKLLEEIRSKREKVIIFTINRLGQDILSFGIGSHFGINIEIINGSNNDQTSVNRKLDAFKKDDGFGVIILSPLAAGVGLTITEANHVIHYERWWNASKEDQASDRVYRIGQDKNVYIHHIIGKLPNGRKSIDEAIHELITQKRETAGFLVPPVAISENDMARNLFADN